MPNPCPLGSATPGHEGMDYEENVGWAPDKHTLEQETTAPFPSASALADQCRTQEFPGPQLEFRASEGHLRPGSGGGLVAEWAWELATPAILVHVCRPQNITKPLQRPVEPQNKLGLDVVAYLRSHTPE